MSYKKEYPSGIRLVLEPVKNIRSVALGIFILVGSRNENKDEAGITHFIEHMLFKGTRRRSVDKISKEVNELGGHINAYTSQEMICLYGKTIDEQTPQLVDLLTDLFFNSVFSPSEIVREKSVVAEEISLYNDTPEELIFDIFIETMWRNNSVGNPVLGRSETLNKFNKKSISDFTKRNFSPDKIVISAAGNFRIDEIEKLISPIVNKFSAQGLPGICDSSKPTPSHRLKIVESPKLDQIHFCLGTDAMNRHSEDRFAMALLNSILGGGAGSRIYNEIREKRGMAYSIGSSITLFTDCGFFTVNGGTQKKFLFDSFDIILSEIRKITKRHVRNEEIDIAKKQIKTSILLGLEGSKTRMMRLGEQEIFFKKHIPVSFIMKKLEALTKSDLLEAAQKYFTEKQLTITTIGPVSKKEMINFEGISI